MSRFFYLFASVDLNNSTYIVKAIFSKCFSVALTHTKLWFYFHLYSEGFYRGFFSYNLPDLYDILFPNLKMFFFCFVFFLAVERIYKVIKRDMQNDLCTNLFRKSNALNFESRKQWV